MRAAEHQIYRITQVARESRFVSPWVFNIPQHFRLAAIQSSWVRTQQRRLNAKT